MFRLERVELASTGSTPVVVVWPVVNTSESQTREANPSSIASRY